MGVPEVVPCAPFELLLRSLSVPRHSWPVASSSPNKTSLNRVPAIRSPMRLVRRAQRRRPLLNPKESSPMTTSHRGRQLSRPLLHLLWQPKEAPHHPLTRWPNKRRQAPSRKKTRTLKPPGASGSPRSEGESQTPNRKSMFFSAKPQRLTSSITLTHKRQ